MRNALIFAALAAAGATSAHATGGLTCRTGGPRPVEVALGFGHVPGAPLIARRLLDNGRDVPVEDAQWWLDRNEVRVLLIAPNGLREEVRVEARRRGSTFDGSLWRRGQRRWVRCREG
jgi:hypothetical protein